MDMNKNLSFKKGKQEDFDALNSFTPGGLYLTTDVGYLYYANSDSKTDIVQVGGILLNCSEEDYLLTKQNPPIYDHLNQNYLYYIPTRFAFFYCSDKENNVWTYVGLEPMELVQHLLYFQPEGESEEDAQNNSRGRIIIDVNKDSIYSIDGVKF